jgi:hypothetical protein
MRKFLAFLPLFLLLLSCGKRAETKAPTSNLDEPDRVLFERSMKDLEKARYTVARLDLQTLISWFRPGYLKCLWRAVVGQLAT